MEERKIAYGGLHCHVNAKAEFVKWGFKNAPNVRGVFAEAILELENPAKSFDLLGIGDGKIGLKMELTNEVCEQIFDKTVISNLMRMKKEGMQDIEQFWMGPVFEMDNTEIDVDILLFLVYAIIRNVHCKQMFEELVRKNQEDYYQAYMTSQYVDISFLAWFEAEEKQMVKLAIGFIELMQEGDEEKYQELMKMLYVGYKPLKNSIKRMHKFIGDDFREFVSKQDEMSMTLAQMVIQMIMAENMKKDIIYDYDTYLVLRQLKKYEEAWMCEQEKPVITKKGEHLYNQLKKEHSQIETYYECIFDMEEDEWTNGIELLFKNYNLNTRMLSEIRFEKREGEMLASLCENMNWEKYKAAILIASLCKYISRLHVLYEKNSPEEQAYQKRNHEQEEQKIREENQKLKQRVRSLDKNCQEQERLLSEVTAQKEKQEIKLETLEKERKLERQEVIELRDFVFRLGEEEEVCKAEKIPNYNIKAEKMVIVGGHENWQRKLKEYLPFCSFITTENLNVDTMVIANKKYIIFNTDILNHALYYKIMNQRKEGQKVLYVHGCNVNKTLQQIGKQMCG